MHRDALHQKAAVLGVADRLGAERPGEGGPSGVAVELVLGGIERPIAACAAEDAIAMLVVQRAGEGPLGRRLAQHLIGEGRQGPLPLGVGLLDPEPGHGVELPELSRPPQFEGGSPRRPYIAT